MIAGLLLAAGRGRRFGSDKLAAKLRGKSVIRWSAESLVSVVAPVYVVVPVGSNVAGKSLSRLDVCFVHNMARDEGMASSIRAGITALPATVQAVVIALGDQPLADATVVRALCDRWHAGGVAAVVDGGFAALAEVEVTPFPLPFDLALANAAGSVTR